MVGLVFVWLPRGFGVVRSIEELLGAAVPENAWKRRMLRHQEVVRRYGGGWDGSTPLEELRRSCWSDAGTPARLPFGSGSKLLAYQESLHEGRRCSSSESPDPPLPKRHGYPYSSVVQLTPFPFAQTHPSAPPADGIRSRAVLDPSSLLFLLSSAKCRRDNHRRTPEHLRQLLLPSSLRFPLFPLSCLWILLVLHNSYMRLHPDPRPCPAKDLSYPARQTQA